MRLSKRMWWVLGCALFFVAIVIGCASMGWYPVAFVNGIPIMARAYSLGYTVAYRYADYFNQPTRDRVSDAALSATIQKAALEGMIDRVLVLNHLHQEMRSNEVQQKVDEYVNRLLVDEKFSTELLSILKVSKSDARRAYLDQQALYAILEGRLTLEQTSLFNWLLKERRAARVTILLPSFYWTGDRVELKSDE
ncbi:MAG: hypothetical protein KBC26_02590 [Candidatus Pacebacteria bacterium]|nr:hypothetical protein [Candidatus Paceibacterota bacterium]